MERFRKSLPSESSDSAADLQVTEASPGAARSTTSEPQDWDRLRRFANGSIYCYVLCFVLPDGSPCAVPIGSLRWNRRGHGFFFQVYASHFDKLGEERPRVCILGVNMSIIDWARGFLTGSFKRPPALRFHALLGQKRPASLAEQAWWRRRTWFLRPFRGARMMWSAMSYVRDLEVMSVEPIRLGPLTRDARI